MPAWISPEILPHASNFVLEKILQRFHEEGGELYVPAAE